VRLMQKSITADPFRQTLITFVFIKSH